VCCVCFVRVVCACMCVLSVVCVFCAFQHEELEVKAFNFYL